jgi:parvulin-like peptidyl-prolyl isomerase
LLLAIATACAWGETIDRMVAIVNNSVILQSDVDDGVRCEAFIQGKPLANVSASAVHDSLDRLIDQELVRQQMGTMDIEISDEAVSKLDELRKERAKSAQQWQSELNAYGIDENVLATCISKQLSTLAFLDRRLRPGVHVERSKVEEYYKGTFVPQLRAKGVKNVPPLTEVERDIREILVQRGINDSLTTWLRNLRAQSRIEILNEPEQAATDTQQAAAH